MDTLLLAAPCPPQASTLFMSVVPTRRRTLQALASNQERSEKASCSQLDWHESVLVQGASPGDIKAQLVASATEGVILDDPAGAASLNGSVPEELDISSTPNLLLYSMLNNQVPSFSTTTHLVAGQAACARCCTCEALTCMGV